MLRLGPSLVLAALAFVWTVGACPPAAAPVTGAPARADSTRPALAARAMVVAGHPEATRIGLDVLRDGGTAVDAAVAVGVRPRRRASRRRQHRRRRLPARPRAGRARYVAATSARRRRPRPRATCTSTSGASRSPYRYHARPPRGRRPRLGGRLAAAHAEGGRLPWARLVEPSVALARGHRLTARTARLFNQYRTRLRGLPVQRARLRARRRAPVARRRPLAAAGPRRDARADPRPRSRWLLPGRDGAPRRRRDGAGTADASPRPTSPPTVRSAARSLTGRYRGHRLLTMPPPSSGGIALLAALRASSRCDAGARSVRARPTRCTSMAEALRRAFADRAHWLGDPDFVDVPPAGLLSTAPTWPHAWPPSIPHARRRVQRSGTVARPHRGHRDDPLLGRR